MPNAINYNVKMTVDAAGTVSTNSVSTLNQLEIATASPVHQAAIQDIGTSWEALAVGDVTTSAKYHVTIRNLDTTSPTAQELQVSFDAGTTQHAYIPGGGFLVISMAASRVIHVKFPTVASFGNVVVSES